MLALAWWQWVCIVGIIVLLIVMMALRKRQG
jgi:hypothetical protein